MFFNPDTPEINASLSAYTLFVAALTGVTIHLVSTINGKDVRFNHKKKTKDSEHATEFESVTPK